MWIEIIGGIIILSGLIVAIIMTDETEFTETEPPFCFDCNLPSCVGCPALKAYREKSHEDGWVEWRNMKFRG